MLHRIVNVSLWFSIAVVSLMFVACSNVCSRSRPSFDVALLIHGAPDTAGSCTRDMHVLNVDWWSVLFAAHSAKIGSLYCLSASTEPVHHLMYE